MKIIGIIRKDLKNLVSDKKALSIMLLMPVILMVILSFALKGIFIDDWISAKVNIAVVEQYQRDTDLKGFDEEMKSGLLSRGMSSESVQKLSSEGKESDPESIFFHDFLDSKDVSDIISYRIETEQKAKEMLKSGEVSAVVLLPDQYVYDMKVNLLTPFRNEIDIKVLTNTNASIDGQIVQSVMQAFADSVSGVIIGKNVLLETAMANDIDSSEFSGIEAVVLDIRNKLQGIRIDENDMTLEGRKPVSSSDYYAAAMLTMFILFAAGHGGRMLLEERENFTYQRMIVAGTSKLAILSGKFLVVFLIAMAQIGVMTVFSHFALGVEWGGFVPVALTGISAAFAVAGVGAVVAAATYRTGNFKMANIFDTAVIQTMALLGGSFFPVDILPSAVQKLSFLSLNGIALKSYQKTMMGYGLDTVLGYIGILTVIGIVFAAVSVIILIGRGGMSDVKHNQAKADKTA